MSIQTKITFQSGRPAASPHDGHLALVWTLPSRIPTPDRCSSTLGVTRDDSPRESARLRLCLLCAPLAGFWQRRSGGIRVGSGPWSGEQRLVQIMCQRLRQDVCDLAVFEDDDAVGRPYGFQPVGDDDTGDRSGADGGIDRALAPDIKMTGGLVKQ